MFVLLLERDLSGRFLSLAHDLDLDSFCSNIIEDQLGTRSALGVYPSSQTDLDILEVLAGLDRLIALEEVSQIGGDFEFVRVRSWSLALAQLLDLATSDFVVLLCLVNKNLALAAASWTHVWRELTLLFFLCLLRFLYLGFRWGSRGLFTFLFFCLSLLLAFLKFALAALI